MELTPEGRAQLAKRAEWGVIAAGVLAAAILGKLFVEQVPLRASRLALADRIMPGLPPEEGEPGPIYLHGGELVAKSVVRHAICANPSAYTNDDERYAVAGQLSHVTGLPIQSIYPRLCVPREDFRPVLRQVTPDLIARVAPLKLKGISVRAETATTTSQEAAPPVAGAQDLCSEPALYTTEREREQVATALARATDLSVDQLLPRLYPRKKTFCYVARQVPLPVVETVRKLDLDGVFTRPEYGRVYPEGALAANVIGRRGVDNKGMTGVERLWGFCLNGKASSRRTNVSGSGQTIIGADSPFVPAEPGAKVVLTLRLPLQKVVEAAMDDLVRDHDPEAATCTVMDPRNGEIVAAASRPTFDPNDVRTSAADDFICRNASEVYEPGSTLKTPMIGAALDSGAVTPQSTFYCAGTTEIGKRPLSCWGEWATNGGHHTVTPEEVIVKSCNIGAAQIALKLDRKTLYRYLERMHVRQYDEKHRVYSALDGTRFYDTLASGLDSEHPAYVPPFADLRVRAQANMGFGQGVYVTDLHMVAIYGAIANGGTFYYPNVVREVRTASGQLIRRRDPLSGGRVFKPETTALLRHFLEQAVAHGTGGTAAIPHVRVGGKTGTAQILDPQHGGFLPDQYIMSFVAIAPIDAPRYVVFVRADKPRIGRHGSDTAAPTVKRVLEAALRLGDDPGA